MHFCRFGLADFENNWHGISIWNALQDDWRKIKILNSDLWTLNFEAGSHDLFFSGSFVDNNSYGCTKLGKIMTSKCIIVSKTLWNFQVNSLNRTEFTDSKFQYFANWVQTIDTLFPTKLVNFVSRVKLDCLLNIGRFKW